jgi:hypothetical protein
LFASMFCEQIVRVAANYQISHDHRASGVSILMLKKWNCNFLSIAIEEVSKNRLILRSFSMEQVPSSQEQELLLMMVAGITLGSFICCYVAESEILITLVSSHL